MSRLPLDVALSLRGNLTDPALREYLDEARAAGNPVVEDAFREERGRRDAAAFEARQLLSDAPAPALPHRLIAFEGIDGAGKATQARLCRERQGADLVSYPRYATPHGELILLLLQNRLQLTVPGGPGVPPLARERVLQALMTYDRYAAPAPATDGRWTVLDRYWHSGAVYGTFDGLDLDELVRVHAPLPQARWNVLVDVPEAVALERIAARGRETDAYESSGQLGVMQDLYQRLWARMAEVHPGRYVVVDGARSTAEVAAAVQEATGL